jgi:RNA polymerase sigma factor for flagellar operon FliA
MGVPKGKSSDYEELIHYGLLGLIEAVDHFDPKFNTRFSTYASLRIRGRIRDYLRASDWMPRTARKRINLIQQTIATLSNESLRAPSEEEIAARIGTDVREVRQGLSDMNRILVSLDMMVTTPEDDEPLEEIVCDDSQANPADALERECLVEEMGNAIRELPEREQLVLSLYYNEELTFKQIGEVLNVTEARVCQLHAYAISILKERMKHE